MPKQAEKILRYIHREKLLKAPFAIYLNLKCLLKKEQSCQNNPEKSYTEKKDTHEPSGWAMFTSCSFDVKRKINLIITAEKIVLKIMQKVKKACNENN